MERDPRTGADPRLVVDYAVYLGTAFFVVIVIYLAWKNDLATLKNLPFAISQGILVALLGLTFARLVRHRRPPVAPPSRLEDAAIGTEGPPGKGPGPQFLSRQTISDFIASVDLSSITRIRVIGITGEVTLVSLCNEIDRTLKDRDALQNVQVDVLLRSVSSADEKRAAGLNSGQVRLARLKSQFRNLNCELRYYSAVLPFRTILFDHTDGSQSAYISFYDWQKNEPHATRETPNPNAYIVLNASDDPIIDIHNSWFDHLWGKHLKHTVIFDFDDTLFFTTAARVSAWMSALRAGVSDNMFEINDLAPDIYATWNNPAEMQKVVLDIFLKYQEEKDIVLATFKGHPRRSVVEYINNSRQSVREKETIKIAEPVIPIIKYLDSLRHEYNIAIISGTSEKTIRRVLNQNGVDFFPYIFGKDTAIGWTNVESKTPSLVRISNMTGIPLERMVFVGDSAADYRAARQTGVDFVEARFNAKRHGRDSLIVPKVDPDPEFVLQPNGPDLFEILRSIERRYADQ